MTKDKEMENNKDEVLFEMRNGFAEVNRQFNEVTKLLESHTEIIAKILVDTTQIKEDMNQKVDKKDFVTLEHRVAHLEDKIL